jgi:hypothetical protein
VTDAELDELISHCPILYHMAEKDSWPSIERHGLLSTTALLDLYAISGDARAAIESVQRPISVTIKKEGIGSAVVRDQSPMDDKGLLRCLQDGLTPQDWYRLLNGKVFFWLTEQRLLRLLNAGNYRNEEHDVLQIDTASLIGAYKDEIWFCPINSGTTKPFPHPRGNSTFSRISNYPYSTWKDKRQKGERAVELCVDYAVPDITRFVTKVLRMKSDQQLKVIFQK